MADHQPQQSPDTAGRILVDDAYHGRLVELSASFDTEAYITGAVKHTLAVFTDAGVFLHLLCSEGAAVTIRLSSNEITALITSYQAYLAHVETQPDPCSAAPEDDDDLNEDRPF